MIVQEVFPKELTTKPLKILRDTLMKGTVIFQVDKAFRKPHMQWCTATFSTSNAFQDIAESGTLSKQACR